MKGGGLACGTENRAHRARFRLDLDGAVGRGGGGLCSAGDARVRGAGGAGGRCARKEAGWHAEPKTEPCGLSFGWKCRGGVGEGPGGLCGVGDGQVSGQGGLGAGARERGAVWRAKPETEPHGLGFGWT